MGASVPARCGVGGGREAQGGRAGGQSVQTRPAGPRSAGGRRQPLQPLPQDSAMRTTVEMEPLKTEPSTAAPPTSAYRPTSTRQPGGAACSSPSPHSAPNVPPTMRLGMNRLRAGAGVGGPQGGQDEQRRDEAQGWSGRGGQHGTHSAGLTPPFSIHSPSRPPPSTTHPPGMVREEERLISSRYAPHMDASVAGV